VVLRVGGRGARCPEPFVPRAQHVGGVGGGVVGVENVGVALRLCRPFSFLCRRTVVLCHAVDFATLVR